VSRYFAPREGFVSVTATDHRDRTSAAQQAQPQHVTALQVAQRIRLDRAAQKRRLATARASAARDLAAELIAEPPEELVTITVRELLLSCRRMGERNVSELLILAGLRGTEQIGDGGVHRGALTPRQRDVLVNVLRGVDVAVREAE
jgi:hypothetical protein